MKIDLHVHSYRSEDSLSAPDDLLVWMHRRGVDMIAVTDHDEIAGALETARLAPGSVIIGEEVRTNQGEIIGLFLRERVSPGRSPEETVAAIHAQGGLVYVPHPMDSTRGSTLARAALQRILPHIDLIEAYNARVPWPGRNREARRYAESHGLPMGAGSDAHRPQDIGLAFVEMSPFDDPTGFLAAVRTAQVRGRLTGPCGRLSTLRARLVKRRQGHRPPPGPAVQEE
jgi:predicted metal-dependent phosphoesterase TrpH